MKEDGYYPDYENSCDNCCAFPVVTTVEDGELIYESDLCGPCFFGTAEALNVEKWNEL